MTPILVLVPGITFLYVILTRSVPDVFFSQALPINEKEYLTKPTSPQNLLCQSIVSLIFHTFSE